MCKNLQDGLEAPTVYRFQKFSSKIDTLVQILGVYRYKNQSIY
jgi:hypothetical protein